MRYSTATLDATPQAFRDAITRAKEEGKGLLIWGGTGTGKTYCLHALANYYRGIHRENWVNLILEARDAISQRRAMTDIINVITSEAGLAIDDLGAENHTDFAQEILYAVINKVYERETKLIVATNLTPEQIGEKYGDRIISRLAEMCVFVELKGEDRRLS